MAEQLIQCPHCQGQLSIGEELFNIELQCPLCQKIFVYPPAPQVQQMPQMQGQFIPPPPQFTSPQMQHPGFPPQMQPGMPPQSGFSPGVPPMPPQMQQMQRPGFPPQMPPMSDPPQKSRKKGWIIAGACIALLIGAVIAWNIMSNNTASEKNSSSVESTTAIETEFNEAFARAGQSSPDDAIKIMEDIAKKYPQHRRINEVNEKITEYENIKKRQAIDAEFNRVLAESDNKSYSDAIDMLEAIIKKYPTHPDVPKAENKIREFTEICRYVYFSNPNRYELSIIVCKFDQNMKNTFSSIVSNMNNWREGVLKAKSLEQQMQVERWHGNSNITELDIFNIQSKAISAHVEASSQIKYLLDEKQHLFVASIWETRLAEIKLTSLPSDTYVWLTFSINDKVAWWGEFKKDPKNTCFYTLK